MDGIVPSSWAGIQSASAAELVQAMCLLGLRLAMQSPGHHRPLGVGLTVTPNCGGKGQSGSWGGLLALPQTSPLYLEVGS